MPPKSKYDTHTERSPQLLMESFIQKYQKEIYATTYTILRNSVVTMEHTGRSTGTTCPGQTGTEVEFGSNQGKTEKKIFCNHCYKAGCIEQH